MTTTTTTPMTARQRAALARLRINHPRAEVFLEHPLRQPDLPLVRIRMRWSKTTMVRWFWINPTGELVSRRRTHATRAHARAPR